jgi:hypothetical protein
MQNVICMAKIKFQQQEAKNKQKILYDIYITNLACLVERLLLQVRFLTFLL